MEEGWECPLGRVGREKAPYAGAAIGLGRHRAEGVAGLEGEGFLYGVDGGEIIVLDFAELEETVISPVNIINILKEQSGRQRQDLLFAKLGRIIDQKVNDDIASAGF